LILGSEKNEFTLSYIMMAAPMPNPWANAAPQQELVGQGDLVLFKRLNAWYVKNPQTKQWEIVCPVSDGRWGPKCAEAMERYYPTHE
jgi:hypothetical protein